MSSAAHIAESADLPAWERDLLNRQLARLERLADSAERVVAEFESRIVAPDPDLSAAERRHAGLDYARAHRALRMTLALQSKLVRDSKTAPAAANDEDEEVLPGSYEVVWPRPATDAEAAAVRATVRAAAEAEHLDPGQIERLTAEATERLERDDIHGFLAMRPFDHVVAHICQELGLEPLLAVQDSSPDETRPPPLAPASGGGGPPAEERVVEGEGLTLHPFHSSA